VKRRQGQHREHESDRECDRSREGAPALTDEHRQTPEGHENVVHSAQGGQTEDDPCLAKWKNGEGVYTSNGGTVAIIKKSSEDKQDPDLFIFGAPAAFRGYYWNWSKELLRRTKGAKNEQRNLWSWLILKAYTLSEENQSKTAEALNMKRDKLRYRMKQFGMKDEEPQSRVGHG